VIFAEKKVTLKDGTQAVLRAPEKADAAMLLEGLKVTAAETDFILRTPEEITMTVEDEEKFIGRLNASPNDTMILAIVDGKYAGNLHIGSSGRVKTGHFGTVAIALAREFWGRGVGTQLMNEAIGIGREAGLHHLELEVFAPNARAIALYKKVGFKTVGTRPFYARLKDGTYMDLDIMQLIL